MGSRLYLGYITCGFVLIRRTVSLRQTLNVFLKRASLPARAAVPRVAVGLVDGDHVGGAGVRCTPRALYGATAAFLVNAEHLAWALARNSCRRAGAGFLYAWRVWAFTAALSCFLLVRRDYLCIVRVWCHLGQYPLYSTEPRDANGASSCRMPVFYSTPAFTCYPWCWLFFFSLRCSPWRRTAAPWCVTCA